jgi:hypothetical protein
LTEGTRDSFVTEGYIGSVNIPGTATATDPGLISSSEDESDEDASSSYVARSRARSSRPSLWSSGGGDIERMPTYVGASFGVGLYVGLFHCALKGMHQAFVILCYVSTPIRASLTNLDLDFLAVIACGSYSILILPD